MIEYDFLEVMQLILSNIQTDSNFIFFKFCCELWQVTYGQIMATKGKHSQIRGKYWQIRRNMGKYW